MTDIAGSGCEPRTTDDKSVEEATIPQSASTAILPAEKNGTEGKDENADEVEPSRCRSMWDRVVKSYWENEFVCLAIIAILLARAYPPLGAKYLAPDITSTWLAVIFIFILAGLGLKTEEFSKAFQRFWFNLSVQTFNFGVVSAYVYGVSRGLLVVNVVPRALADGMVICACLPLTINMVLVLTKASGGDEAAAVFHAAFGNLCGVFLSPLLILGYLGVSTEIDLLDVFYKLSLRVVVPVAFGQLLRKFSPPVVAYVDNHKNMFKQAQQYCLIFIVYAVFCVTFTEDTSDSDIGDIFIMIGVQFCLLCSLMAITWIVFKFLFPNEPTLRVMALFGATHKTVAMGIPLINSIYEDDPLVGLYTLPLLIWHPMQLVLGTYLAPKLDAWVKQEQERLEPSDTTNNDATITPGSGDEESPSQNSSEELSANQVETTDTHPTTENSS